MQSLCRFAVDVYQTPGITTLCLNLQDQNGCDIPLLMFLCWHGCYMGKIPAPALHQAASLSRQWAAQLVHPLRATRRWLKPDPDGLTTHIELSRYHTGSAPAETLREQIKALELKAEFVQLEALEQLAQQSLAEVSRANRISAVEPENLHVAEPRLAVEENLKSALALTGVKLDRQKLEPLIAASLMTADHH